MAIRKYRFVFVYIRRYHCSVDDSICDIMTQNRMHDIKKIVNNLIPKMNTDVLPVMCGPQLKRVWSQISSRLAKFNKIHKSYLI
jgi:hypothetical protein